MVPWDHAEPCAVASAIFRIVELCVGFDRYWPRCARALRSGALEICISPWKGLYISRIKKIAPETDSAETSKLVITVALKGAKRPKLMKMTVSQITSTTSNGMETEVACCAYINQRVLPISTAILNTWL